MAPDKGSRSRSRKDYRFSLEYRTRWWAVPVSIASPVAASPVSLTDRCGLHPPTSAQHPLMAHTRCDYYAAITYPKVAELCLRVNKLSRSSVVYEVALFEKGIEQVKAVGEFVHVFVDRATQRPNAAGMDPQLRQGLEELLVAPSPSPSDSTTSKL
ncbi:HotDog domain-containing protein [Hypoxylon cercidicola]|nr:HotDog domain-containing protein [Hypoxylon cercidicola]